MEPIRVFIGFDEREAAAFAVLSHSIHRHASTVVTITPVMLSQLTAVFSRPRIALQSTDFSFSRFLVPYLSGYQGWSLFMDCDMIMRDDIAKLWALRDDRYTVMCVKHDYAPVEKLKFLDQPQTAYQKKNWSSVMLFNNAKCRALTTDYVNSASGLDLHQFKWLGDDSLIGEIPPVWNHLVGEYPNNSGAALVHFTIGGPYFQEYRNCEFGDEWFTERERALRVDQRQPK